MSIKTPCYLPKCCFCIDTKIGCFILGYLNLVGVVLATIHGTISLTKIVIAVKDNVPIRPLGPMNVAITIVFFFFLLLGLAFNVALLVGLHQNKPAYVEGYLIFFRICLAINAFVLMVAIVAGYQDILEIVIIIIHILYSIYTWFVFRSHFIDMKVALNEPV